MSRIDYDDDNEDYDNDNESNDDEESNQAWWEGFNDVVSENLNDPYEH